MVSFEIYFADLKPEVQENLLKFLGIDSPEDGSYDVFPLAVLYFDGEEERSVNYIPR